MSNNTTETMNGQQRYLENIALKNGEGIVKKLKKGYKKQPVTNKMDYLKKKKINIKRIVWKQYD